MNETPRPVVVLSRALDQARAALTTLDPEDLDGPTHCGSWTVRDLTAHLVAAPEHFLQMARGEEVDWSAAPAAPEEEWPQHFQAQSEQLLEHWAGRAEDDVAMADWQSAEIGVHTWDLLRATGHSMPLDPEVAERGLAFMRQGMTDDNRGDAFGPALAVAADAPAYERLVAFAGRDPRG